MSFQNLHCPITPEKLVSQSRWSHNAGRSLAQVRLVHRTRDIDHPWIETLWLSHTASKGDHLQEGFYSTMNYLTELILACKIPDLYWTIHLIIPACHQYSRCRHHIWFCMHLFKNKSCDWFQLIVMTYWSWSVWLLFLWFVCNLSTT